MPEKVKFSRPVSKLDDANWQTTPASLNNAYLDRQTGGVKRANELREVDTGTEFTPGNKPNIIWGGDILEGQGEGLQDADTFNENLYAVDGNGLTVYPPGYDGTNADTLGPHIRTVQHSLSTFGSYITGQTYNTFTAGSGQKYASTDEELYGVVSYLLIPYNERDEAGPWVYHSATYQMMMIQEKVAPADSAGGTLVTAKWFEKPVVSITAEAWNETTSYVEVYRTAEALGVLGFDSEMTYYYMGRFQVAEDPNVSAAGAVRVVDDKLWWKPGWVGQLAYWRGWKQDGDYPALISPERLLEAGVIDPERLVLPSATLDRTLNVHTQRQTDPGTGSYGDQDTIELYDAGSTAAITSRAYPVPENFFARSVNNVGGTMVYSDVTWKPKYPAVMAFQASPTGTDPLGDDVIFQYEYRLSDGEVYYGPELRLNDVFNVMIAWQGEQALIIKDTAGDLIERLIPDGFGRYVSGFDVTVNREVWDPSANSGDGGLVSDTINRTVFWTYSNKANGVSTTTFSGSPSTSFREKNVGFLSAFERPWEVTLDQFYMPDNSRIRAHASARLEETEQILDYDSYLFTDKTVFWIKIDATSRQITQGVVTPVTGVKQTDFTSEETGLVAEVNGGVIFVGEDENVYFLSGRRVQRIDREGELEGLWTEIWDIDYHITDKDLWLLTDTGVWVWDFDHYGGIYKHHSYTKNSSSNAVCLTYLKGDITGAANTPYDNMMVYEDNLDKGFLMDDGAKVKDASVEMHETPWSGLPVKISRMRVYAEHGPKVAQVDLTDGGALTIDANQNAEFEDPSEVGLVAQVEDALNGGGNLQAEFDSIASTTSATVSAVTGSITTGGVSNKRALWPILTVKHRLAGRKDAEYTYAMMPGIDYYPKGAAMQHGLTLERFDTLYEVLLDFRQQ